MVIEEFPPGMSSKPADIIRTSIGSAMKRTNLTEMGGYHERVRSRCFDHRSHKLIFIPALVREGKGWKSPFLAFNFQNNIEVTTFVYYQA